ncbi:hypothetical protein B0H19DRAFT_476946 [Mycena capillaripes]|nr:hypothetical protein B0H19DRAFT_476946 [Mycena capillaripes]
MLYYRLYNRGGEENSVRSDYGNEPARGQVKRTSIASPRSVISVRRRIARIEGKLIYEIGDLFREITADRPCPPEALLDAACGSTENPILIVQPESRPGLYNRPVLIVALPQELDPHSYIRRHRGIDTRWLSPSVGDIIHTDGVARIENGNSGYPEHRVYTAVDKSGRTGWISWRRIACACISLP